MTSLEQRTDGWLSTSMTDAPDGVAVETKIEDRDGVRNIQTLKRRGGLWFTPDGAMYVYYRPTHWRALAHKERA